MIFCSTLWTKIAPLSNKVDTTILISILALPWLASCPISCLAELEFWKIGPMPSIFVKWRIKDSPSSLTIGVTSSYFVTSAGRKVKGLTWNAVTTRVKHFSNQFGVISPMLLLYFDFRVKVPDIIIQNPFCEQQLWKSTWLNAPISEITETCIFFKTLYISPT